MSKMATLYIQQALKAGAISVTEMTELFWGDRVGRVRDPFGNIWWIQTSIEDVDPEEMGRRAGEQHYLDAMRYVQDTLNRELESRQNRV
jgi:PhnB protein